jgi:hypothetical protein
VSCCVWTADASGAGGDTEATPGARRDNDVMSGVITISEVPTIEEN